MGQSKMPITKERKLNFGNTHNLLIQVIIYYHTTTTCSLKNISEEKYMHIRLWTKGMGKPAPSTVSKAFKNVILCFWRAHYYALPSWWSPETREQGTSIGQNNTLNFLFVCTRSLLTTLVFILHYNMNKKMVLCRACTHGQKRGQTSQLWG